MTDEQSVERALEWMVANVSKLSQAVADRKYLEDYRKVKWSALVLNSPPGTVSSKEAWATSHTDYVGVLKGLKVAVQQESELKHLFTIAEAKIEVWRTIQANNRAGVV